MHEMERIEAAVSFLREQGVQDARLCLVLGSGMRSFGERLTGRVEIPFGSVPHWPGPKVEGHGGSVVIGDIGGLRVACLTGRVHLYEGWEPAEVVRAVRTMRHSGIEDFVLTNAAGGLHPDWAPGTLMLICDHLNMTGSSPLLGPIDAAMGPRFPDQSNVYSHELRGVMRGIDADLVEGVYVGNLGPSYETPAEVAMARSLGGDAVGMSTVHEAMALNAMGARLAGVSLISNLAAGISGEPLDHEEVIAVGKQAESRLTTLLTGFCEAMSS